MRGTNRIEMDSVGVGDICATLKLKNTHTSNTLTEKAKAVEIAPMDLPFPLVEKAVYPKARATKINCRRDFAAA